MTTTTLHMSIGGMSCASCSGAVEGVMLHFPNVTKASVNLALATAEVHFDTNTPDTDGLIAAISKAGFQATLQDDATPHPPESADNTSRKNSMALWIAALLTAPFIINMIAMTSGNSLLSPWLQLALATPVQLIMGWRFHIGAIKAIRRKTANMDVLVSLGTSVAYGFSLWQMFDTSTSGHLYFEASAMIITLILFGKWLENRAKRSASAAIRALMALRPEDALVRRDNADIRIPIADVRISDTLIIKPGDRIPVDGVVIDGATDVDESLITGESLPVTKGIGDTLVAGAINGTGMILMSAERVGNDTTLGRIIKLVSAAQTGKAPIQRLVDKIAAIFVPVVVSIAVITFIGWLATGASIDAAFTAAVSVLVIACPCAMGLATPAALVAGTGAAAKAGILIRDIETLERANATRVVVFDKTGTLTLGAPQLVNMQTAFDDAMFLRLVAAAQKGSEHPLAKGVLAYVGDAGDLPPVTDFKSIGGSGLMATVEDQAITIGTASFLHGQNITTEAFDAIALDWQSTGHTVSMVAIQGTTAGCLGFMDTVRPQSKPAISRLKAQGYTPWILSGDNPETVKRIAEDLGIKHVIGSAKPGDKSFKVFELQATGQVVAMVGDGINDAPALAQADVSIAMGSGTDVAMETAGITLMRSDPNLVPATFAIAKATRRTIRQNLFWAFAYNIVGIPIAAFGFLHPSFAGAAMALSSISVVANALRLKYWTPDKA